MASTRHDAIAAGLAFMLCALALLGFGLALPGYSHLAHPAALLGATGIPRALAFNALGFIVPGLLAAAVAVRLRARLPAAAGVALRLGPWLLALSGLAFALQGLLPLDPTDLDADASRRHAVAWTLWQVAALPAAVAFALCAWRAPGLRALAVVAAFAALVLLSVVALPLPGPPAQRVALAAWFALAWTAARAPRPQP